MIAGCSPRWKTGELHLFGKGMGVAAPQTGVGRAAAIVSRPTPTPSRSWCSTRGHQGSAETDEQYEGCLTFFDVRGLVPRPLHIEVTCTRPDGSIRTLPRQRRGTPGRPEIDHLKGVSTPPMREGTRPVPVAEYRGTGHA